MSTLIGGIAQQLAGVPTASSAKDKHGETNLRGRCTRRVMVVGGNQDPVLNPPNRGVAHIASSVFSSLPAPTIRNTHTSSDTETVRSLHGFLNLGRFARASKYKHSRAHKESEWSVARRED